MESLEYIRGRLSAPGVVVREVAQGAGVRERWLRLFIAGRIPEPGYGKVQRLYDYLMTAEATGTDKEAA